MASSIVFVIMFLTLTTTIHARESQFFAKVSNNIPKQETQQQTLTNTNQQDPTFIPQSQDSGPSYGLYGHGSGQLPPSTTTTNNGLPANLPENYNPVAYTTPIHSSTQDIPEENEPQTYKVDNNMYNSEKQDEYMGTNGDNMYNSEKQEYGTNGGNMFNYEKQGMSDTRFMENEKYNYNGENGYNSEKQGFNDASFMQTENGGNMYNYEKQGENEMYNSEKQGFNDASFMETENGGDMYNNQKLGTSEMYNSEKQGMGGYNGNMYNTGKQGMSDTRFLENGKYYYDLNSERLNANANVNSRGVRNGFNTQGYSWNNENTYDKYNSNGGYQNQEEFQVNQNNQYNP